MTRGDRARVEVALDHGFASAATVARAFRAHFGTSASQWRAGGAARWRARRKPGKHARKPGKTRRGGRRHTARTRREEEIMSVEVRDLPAHHVASMRYVGPSRGPGGIPALWIDRAMHTRWEDVLAPRMRPVHRTWRAPGGAPAAG
ncbi:MAG TPA: hypothetical protein VFV05_15855 [Methylomirabilota bacterium]|nr:hypothetical protein [Methylomirabilota bacterium]